MRRKRGSLASNKVEILCALFMRPRRLVRVEIVLKPSYTVRDSASLSFKRKSTIVASSASAATLNRSRIHVVGK